MHNALKNWENDAIDNIVGKNEWFFFNLTHFSMVSTIVLLYFKNPKPHCPLDHAFGAPILSHIGKNLVILFCDIQFSIFGAKYPSG